MVSWLSMASHGTAEANVKVMLQAVIAGAAVWFVCLGNGTFYLHPLISHLFEFLLFPYSLGAVGWQFMPPSFLMCWSRQGSEYTFLMILLYLSLWHSHSHCFLLGFLLSTVPVWLESARRCDMRMPARLQRFPVPTGLHPFLLHPDPVRMPSTHVVSLLSYPLTIVSQWKIHVLSCITQVA